MPFAEKLTNMGPLRFFFCFNRKDMFNVSAQVLVELGLQLTQFLLSLPHVFLQLQTRLSGVVVASCQSSAVAHLVTW